MDFPGLRRRLRDHYWINIAPFDGGGHFCGRGFAYLSAILVADPTECALAERSRQAVVERFPDQTLSTPILEAATFYPVKGVER